CNVASSASENADGANLATRMNAIEAIAAANVAAATLVFGRFRGTLPDPRGVVAVWLVMADICAPRPMSKSLIFTEATRATVIQGLALHIACQARCCSTGQSGAGRRDAHAP